MYLRGIPMGRIWVSPFELGPESTPPSSAPGRKPTPEAPAATATWTTWTCFMEHPMIRGVPEMGVPQKCWFITESPTKIDDLIKGTPFTETPRMVDWLWLIFPLVDMGSTLRIPSIQMSVDHYLNQRNLVDVPECFCQACFDWFELVSQQHGWMDPFLWVKTIFVVRLMPHFCTLSPPECFCVL